MTTEDLVNYEVVERAPVCIEYRGHNVCGMGPPSSGALAVGQILGILENFDLGDDPLDVEAVHLFTQAGRLAFADRGLYVGDTDFVTVPIAGMLDKNYLAQRAALITDMDMGTAEPGEIDGFDPTAPDLAIKTSGTSHISIVDRYGNALSMTTTIESSFGNGVMVNGFLLNNELTDFSFRAFDDSGTAIANPQLMPGPEDTLVVRVVRGKDLGERLSVQAAERMNKPGPGMATQRLRGGSIKQNGPLSVEELPAVFAAFDPHPGRFRTLRRILFEFLCRQADLAATLTRIRDLGPDGFYAGRTADLIVEEMERGGGIITHRDLADYEPAWREPVRFTYREHTILSMPPSSSGGATMAEMANILEGYDLGSMPWHGPEMIHLYAEAWKRAYADRNHYLADPDFVDMPLDRMTSAEYAQERAATINAWLEAHRGEA